MDEIQQINELWSRITDDVADALRRIKKLEKHLSSEESEAGALEPQMPFLPCKYIFFPVEITSVSTIGTLAYGKILEPDFSIDSDFDDPIEITVPPSGIRPAVGDVVRADYIGNIAVTTVTTVTSTGTVTEQITAVPVYSVFSGANDAWVELAEALDVNGTAGGRLCTWGTDAATFTVSTTPDALVMDVLGQCWGLTGERLRCRPMTSGNSLVYVAQGPGASWRYVQLDDDLNHDSYQTASVYGGINGRTALLTVYSKFSSSGFMIPSQAFVGAEYDATAGKWIVTEARCNW